MSEDRFEQASRAAGVGRACEACVFAMRLSATGADGPEVFQCRRYPPTFATYPGKPAVAEWPKVVGYCWCGEFERRPAIAKLAS